MDGTEILKVYHPGLRQPPVWTNLAGHTACLRIMEEEKQEGQVVITAGYSDRGVVIADRWPFHLLDVWNLEDGARVSSPSAPRKDGEAWCPGCWHRLHLDLLDDGDVWEEREPQRERHQWRKWAHAHAPNCPILIKGAFRGAFSARTNDDGSGFAIISEDNGYVLGVVTHGGPWRQHYLVSVDPIIKRVDQQGSVRLLDFCLGWYDSAFFEKFRSLKEADSAIRKKAWPDEAKEGE